MHWALASPGLLERESGRSIGSARMRQTVKSSFFIGNLDKSGRRRSHSGVARISRQVPAVLVDAAISENRKELTNLIRLGEGAQSLRSARELARAGQGILDIALESDFHWIGKYYCALALNRLGLRAFPKSNKILEEVADHGPTIYRGKALVALGTNRCDSGDRDTALELYQDAAKIGGPRSRENPHLRFLILFQTAVIQHREGDNAAALRGFQELMPLVSQLGPEHTGLIHQYFNNLVALLTADGQLAEADHYSKILRCSPFGYAYPELWRTCADLDLIKAQQPSQSTLFLARGDLTAAETATLESPSRNWMPTSPAPDLRTAVDAPDADQQPAFDSDFDRAPVDVESLFPVQRDAAETSAPGNRPVVPSLQRRAALLYPRLTAPSATVRKHRRAGREPFKSVPPVNREVTSPRALRSQRQCPLSAPGGWVASARAPPGLTISNPIDTTK